jgi:hypothetical protein
MTATVVWVMMVWSSHSWVAPTLMFETKSQCQTAITDIKQQIPKSDWFRATCVKVKGVR